MPGQKGDEVIWTCLLSEGVWTIKASALLVLVQLCWSPVCLRRGTRASRGHQDRLSMLTHQRTCTSKESRWSSLLLLWFFRVPHSLHCCTPGMQVLFQFYCSFSPSVYQLIRWWFELLGLLVLMWKFKWSKLILMCDVQPFGFWFLRVLKVLKVSVDHRVCR